MNKVNQWVIGTLPYAVAISFVLIYWLNTSYYFILGAACVILFIINIFANKNFEIKKYTFFILFFGIYLIFSNAFIAKNRFIVYYELFKNQFLYTFFILNIIENTTFTKKQIKRWFVMFEITIWATLVVILLQQFYSYEFLQNKATIDAVFQMNFVSQSEFRMISIYSWSGGLDLIFYFIPISYFMINHEINNNRMRRAIMFTVILLVVCIFSKSRSTMVAAAPVIFILQNSSRRKTSKNIADRYLILIGLFLITYISFTNIPVLRRIWDDRILESSKGGLENRSMSTRLLAFEAFIKCFPDQPLLGAGNTKYSSGAKGVWNYKLSSFLAGRSAQIHVGLIDLFYLYGIVGGSLYAIFSIITLRKTYINSRKYNFRAVFWALMTIPLANLGIVTFNMLGAGLLLAFALNKNLKVLSETPVTKKKLVVPVPITPTPVAV